MRMHSRTGGDCAVNLMQRKGWGWAASKAGEAAGGQWSIF